MTIWCVVRGAWCFRSRPRLRFVFPAQPKEVESEKRNEPAVAILFVVTPLGTEMPAADEPQRAEGKAQRNDRPPGTSWNRRLLDWCCRGEDGTGHSAAKL